MKMNEPHVWAPGERRAVLQRMFTAGEAIEVTHRAPKWFSGPVGIETAVFDRFVAWAGDAQRRHAIHLEEDDRLSTLLESSGIALCSTGGCFVCRAVDACGRSDKPDRHFFVISNFGSPLEPAWLIHT